MKKRKKCIAYREVDVDVGKRSIVYVPCGKMIRGNKMKRRFCTAHEQAYRELVLGILMNGRK